MPFMMPNQQMSNNPNLNPNPSASPNASISATPMRSTGSRSPNTAVNGGGPNGSQQQQQGPGPARSNTRGQSHFKPY